MNTYHFQAKVITTDIHVEDVYENNILIGTISTKRFDKDKPYQGEFAYQLIKIFQSITSNVPSKIFQFLNEKNHNNDAILRCIDDHFPKYKEELEKYLLLL